MITGFEAANRILGHGEPEQAVWFVGLEYADAYDSAAEAVKDYTLHGEVQRPAGKPDFSGLGPKGRSIRLLTSRILRLISRAGSAHEDHEWFMNNRLWWPGSETFQANLFPLGRPRHGQPLCRHYDAVEWGMSNWTDETYLGRVIQERFPLLRKHWNASARKAVVCFGGSEWGLFRQLYEIAPDAETVPVVPGKVIAYPTERVVLAPFFTFEFNTFTYDDADKVGAFLRDEWRVGIA